MTDMLEKFKKMRICIQIFLSKMPSARTVLIVAKKRRGVN